MQGENESHPETRNASLLSIKERLDAIRQLGSDPKKSDEILRNAREAKRIFDSFNPTDDEAKQIGFKDSRALRTELWSWLE